MNVSELMLNAKAGLINAKPERMISNKGSINEIRKRTKEQLRPAGFPKYAILGSQNAISSEPPKESSITIDIEIDDKAPEPAPAPAPTEPPEKTEGKKKPLLPGATQSEKSKEMMEERKSDEAVKPSQPPPYYLPTEKPQLDAMIQYLKDKYGQASKKYVDDLKEDSKEFSSSVEIAKQIGIAINEFRQKDLGKEFLFNKLKQAGKLVIDKIASLAKESVDFGEGNLAVGAGELTKLGIDELKKLINEKALKEDHVEQQLKATQDALFSVRPEWKKKWESLLNAENERARREFKEYLLREFGGNGSETQYPDSVDKSKLPFGGLF